MNKDILKSLSFFDGMCLVVGCVLGIGIYQTPPLIAASVGNEFELYAIWLVGALLTLAGAMCYVELATSYPEEGGDYHFLKLAFGPWAGFLYGWSQSFLIRPGAIAAVAFPFATYFASTFPSYLDSFDASVIASLAIVVLSLFNIVGTALGALTQNVLSVLSYSLLLALAIAGIFYGEQSHMYFEETYSNSNYGLALILVLFTFGGWSELALVAGEVVNPKVNFFRSMVTGVVLITLLYCVINFAYCSSLGFDRLRSVEAPAALMFPNFGIEVVAALVAVCCLSSLNALILASSRISFAFGRDFQWFSSLSNWDQKRNSPVRGLALQCLLSVIIALVAGSFRDVLVYTTAVVWLFYFAVGLSVYRLRRKFPDKQLLRPTWGYPVTPLVFCASCLFLVYSAFDYDFTGSAITLSFVVLGYLVFLRHPKNYREL